MHKIKRGKTKNPTVSELKTMAPLAFGIFGYFPASVFQGPSFPTISQRVPKANQDGSVRNPGGFGTMRQLLSSIMEGFLWEACIWHMSHSPNSSRGFYEGLDYTGDYYRTY